MTYDMIQALQRTYSQSGRGVSAGFHSVEQSVSHMGKTFESAGAAIDHWTVSVLDIEVERLST